MCKDVHSNAIVTFQENRDERYRIGDIFAALPYFETEKHPAPSIDQMFYIEQANFVG